MVDPSPTVTFADTVTGISPPASSAIVSAPPSSCSLRSSATRRSVANSLLLSLVGVMFGACLLYLVSRLVALTRKVSMLEQTQKKNDVTVADAAQDISDLRRAVQHASALQSSGTVQSRGSVQSRGTVQSPVVGQCAPPSKVATPSSTEGSADVIPEELRAMLPFVCGGGARLPVDNINLMIFEAFREEFAQPADLAAEAAASSRVEELFTDDDTESDEAVPEIKAPEVKAPDVKTEVKAVEVKADVKVSEVKIEVNDAMQEEVSAFVTDLVAPMAAAVKEFEKEAATPGAATRAQDDGSSGSEAELDVKATPPPQHARPRRGGRAKKRE